MTLDFPVRVASASLSGSVVAVPVESAREVVARSAQSAVLDVPGAEFAEVRGRTAVTVLHVRYHDDPDNVLGAYHEFGLGVPVRVPGHGLLQHVIELPVDQEFTLEAGRRLWGYPKWRAHMEGRAGAAVDPFSLSVDGRELVRAVFDAGRLPALRRELGVRMDSLQVLDGRPVVVRARARVSGVRVRPGGVRLTVGESGAGDGGRLVDVTRDLGLERGRALGTFAFARFAAEFGAAVRI